MSKVIVLGEKSFMASHLPYEKKPGKMVEEQCVWDMLSGLQPGDVCINSIGKTSGITKSGLNNVDWCEETTENKIQTSFANTILPIWLAKVCSVKNVKLIHISSGCIFCGASPNTVMMDDRLVRPGARAGYIKRKVNTGWKETDHSNPGSYYAKCKAAADIAIADFPNVAIVRLRMPISTIPSPRNLISKITQFRRVVHSLNSISPLSEVAKAIQWIIDNNKTGIYNVASPKSIYHSQILDEYAKYNKDYLGYENIDETELQTLVSAPRSNCILDVSKIQNEGFIFEDTDNIIERYVKEFAENEKKVK